MRAYLESTIIGESDGPFTLRQAQGEGLTLSLSKYEGRGLGAAVFYQYGH